MTEHKWDPIATKRAIDMELEFGSPSFYRTEGADAEADTSTPISRLTSEALARNKARAAAPVAMDAIIHLATYSENEQLRFKAASYLVDRVLGRITDVPMDGSALDESDPLTKLVQAAYGGQNAN
ncbi:MAG: hypothetical protein LC687_01470 [Actinobacteria bacterium]|nr:hypothetical protein [Actinomycetota bacterium]